MSRPHSLTIPFVDELLHSFDNAYNNDETDEAGLRLLLEPRRSIAEPSNEILPMIISGLYETYDYPRATATIVLFEEVQAVLNAQRQALYPEDIATTTTASILSQAPDNDAPLVMGGLRWLWAHRVTMREEMIQTMRRLEVDVRRERVVITSDRELLQLPVVRLFLSHLRDAIPPSLQTYEFDIDTELLHYHFAVYTSNGNYPPWRDDIVGILLEFNDTEINIWMMPFLEGYLAFPRNESLPVTLRQAHRYGHLQRMWDLCRGQYIGNPRRRAELQQSEQRSRTQQPRHQGSVRAHFDPNVSANRGLIQRREQQRAFYESRRLIPSNEQIDQGGRDQVGESEEEVEGPLLRASVLRPAQSTPPHEPRSDNDELRRPSGVDGAMDDDIDMGRAMQGSGDAGEDMGKRTSNGDPVDGSFQNTGQFGIQELFPTPFGAPSHNEQLTDGHQVTVNLGGSSIGGRLRSKSPMAIVMATELIFQSHRGHSEVTRAAPTRAVPIFHSLADVQVRKSNNDNTDGIGELLADTSESLVHRAHQSGAARGSHKSDGSSENIKGVHTR